MIDKINNITAGNTQNKRAAENAKEKVTSSSSATASKNSNDANNTSNVEISSQLNLKSLSDEAPINTAKVSAIKDAIAKGNYPIDLDKVADALMQAYKDIN